LRKIRCRWCDFWVYAWKRNRSGVAISGFSRLERHVDKMHHQEWLEMKETCYFCDKEYTADEWEDHHTPVEQPLSHCHARCCDNIDCNEQHVSEGLVNE
jgi:hypothetical protein